MEKNEISIHEIWIWKVFSDDPTKWFTNHEVAKACSKVSPRTVRAHTKKLVDLGLLDQAELFPAHRFKLADKGSKRNSHAKRIADAAKVFGV